MSDGFRHTVRAVLLFCLLSGFMASAAGPCGPQLKRADSTTTLAPQSEVKGIISRLETRIDSVYSTSGFANKAELLVAVAASAPEYRQAAAMLAIEDFEVIAAAPPRARSGILRNRRGLKSSHVVGFSMGALLDDKDVIESAFLREDPETYSAYKATTKPIYVFLAPKPGLGLKGPRGIWSYGSDRWILKMKNVRNRLTLCAGDSLNRVVMSSAGDPWVRRSESWDTHFIPWSRRELLIPALGQALKQGYVGLPTKPFVTSVTEHDKKYHTPPMFAPRALERIVSADQRAVFMSNNTKLNPIEGPLQKFKMSVGWDLDYVEGHVWEPSFDDIAAYEFDIVPPTGDFLQDLLDNHVPIRDNREGLSQPWTPPAPRVAPRRSLSEILRPQSRGVEVLDFLGQENPDFKKLLAGSTDSWEGYSVEQHTLMVYARFAVEFPKYKFTVPPDVRLRETLMIAIGVHETYSSEGFEYRKPMVQLLERTMKRHGFSEAEIRLAKAILGNDTFGEFLRGYEQDPEAKLLESATLAGMPLADYVRLQFFFYTIDASSYPILRANIFATEPDGRLLPSRQYHEKFYTLLQKLGVAI